MEAIEQMSFRKKTIQPKMHSSRGAGPVSGVVQANVIGGNPALRARLSLLANDSGGAPVQMAHSVQCQTGSGVEAFQVPLRQEWRAPVAVGRTHKDGNSLQLRLLRRARARRS